MIEALDGLTHAVPKQTDTETYHRVTVAARTALEASDKAALTEAQWQHVDDVLAAFLPDFARTESTADQRREMISEVEWRRCSWCMGVQQPGAVLAPDA